MMEELLFFFEVLLGGLLTGIMYSLVALGLVLIFKASQIFNFAQGAFVLFAALTFVLMIEVGPGFWSWTGWLAVAFALLAAGIWGLRRYTTVLDAPKRYGRTPVVIAALAAVLLPILLDGGQPMWRAIFIVELTFLMLTVGARTPELGGRRPARPRGGLLLPRRGDAVARARGDPAGDDHDGHRHRADRAPPARQPGAHHPCSWPRSA